MVPEKPNFKFGFGAVPQIISGKNPKIVAGAFVIGDYPDEKNAAHIYDIKSAGVAIPVAVDTIFTRKVIA